MFDSATSHVAEIGPPDVEKFNWKEPIMWLVAKEWACGVVTAISLYDACMAVCQK